VQQWPKVIGLILDSVGLHLVVLSQKLFEVKNDKIMKFTRSLECNTHKTLRNVAATISTARFNIKITLCFVHTVFVHFIYEEGPISLWLYKENNKLRD
jgi:hypothetical protein